MKKLILIALILVAASSLNAAGRWNAILDVAPLIPQGDLAEGYDTPAGMGAGSGYEVGFRLRQAHRNSALSIAMNIGKPGKYSDANDDDPFDVSASIFRYSADYTWYMPTQRNAVQYFLTAGGSLNHNVYKDEYLNDGEFFEHGVNAIGANLGVGAKKGEFEFTLSYHVNRFDTIQIWDGVENYNWDYVTARVGIILPTY
jgi:hypothetical protein